MASSKTNPAGKGKPCTYCEQGIELRGDEHWIVKSVTPARIDIRKCSAPKPSGQKVSEYSWDDAMANALRWCRPRLSKGVYRERLDKMVSLPPAPPSDEPRLVQSADAPAGNGYGPQRLETSSENLARDMREGRFPQRSDPAVYEAPRDTSQPLKVRGVGRVGDEPRALLVLLNERPTDDELRSVHDHLKSFGEPNPSYATGMLLKVAKQQERERCAALLDDRAQYFNSIRDPGMANHCRSLASLIMKPQS